MIVSGTFGAVRLLLVELFNQPDPRKKLIKTDKPPKGVTARSPFADFDLSATKKRLKFLPIVLLTSPDPVWASYLPYPPRI
jgi:hypothetical protein